MKKLAYLNRDMKTLEELVTYINTPLVPHPSDHKEEVMEDDAKIMGVKLGKFKDKFTLDELVDRINIIKQATSKFELSFNDVLQSNIDDPKEVLYWDHRKVIATIYKAIKDLQDDVSGLNYIEREDLKNG